MELIRPRASTSFNNQFLRPPPGTSAGPGAAAINSKKKPYNQLWSAYSTQVEIFIALWNVDYKNSGTENKPVKANHKTMARKVIVYTKPPGAMQWVEQCVTETVFREKNPKFATKPLIQYEPFDAPSINLKFEVHDAEREEGSLSALLGCVEITLEQLINAGSPGLEIPIFSLIAPYAPKNVENSRIEPGRIFIRGEVIKPPMKPNEIPTTIILKFGLKRPSTACCLFQPKIFPYYYEIYKLNEQSLFEIKHQYTLIHRSDLLHPNSRTHNNNSHSNNNTHHLPTPTTSTHRRNRRFCPNLSNCINRPITTSPSGNHRNNNNGNAWSYCALPAQRVCNGDYGRILKIELYQEDHPDKPKGFVFTTLGKMLMDRELEFRVVKKSGSVSNKIQLFVPLCYEIALHPFNYYLGKGVTLRVIYAVDYSDSNWNTLIHPEPLHNLESNRTPYEDALIITAGTIEEVAYENSIFYSFGTKEFQPYISTIDPTHQIPALLRSYKDALFSQCTAINTMKNQLPNRSPYSQYSNPRYQGNCNSTSNHAVGRERRLNSIQRVGENSTSSNPNYTTHLSPLLFEILSLVSRRSQTFEYHVVFIYTDGQIADLDQCMEAIVQLARLPVSLIFIAIGVADLKQILALEKCWAHPRTGEFPCRRIVRVVHFRSLTEWDTSVKLGNYQTSPPELYSREIFTTLCDQMPGYMRIFKTTI